MIEILVYAADEVEKEIDGLMDNFKEMELQKDEKMEQLKREKEWLIKLLYKNICATPITLDAYRRTITDLMQQEQI